MKTPGFVYLFSAPEPMNLFSHPPSLTSSRRLFTVLLLAFLIHNAEEAYTICYFPTVNPLINIQILNCEQFLVAVSVISTVVIVLYMIAARSMVTPNRYLFISTGLAAALLLNAIVPHLLVALLTWQFTPGIFSTVLLIIPLSILMLSRNREHYKSRREQIRHAILFTIPAYLFFVLVTRLSMLYF